MEYIVIMAIMTGIIYPTEFHRNAICAITDFFLRQPHTDAILLVNSLARGKATADSDIDITILVKEGTNRTEMVELENISQNFLNVDRTINRYTNSNKFERLRQTLEGNGQLLQFWTSARISGRNKIYRASIDHLKVKKSLKSPNYFFYLRV